MLGDKIKSFINNTTEMVSHKVQELIFEGSVHDGLKAIDKDFKQLLEYKEKCERLENALGFWENGMNTERLEQQADYWKTSFLREQIEKDKILKMYIDIDASRPVQYLLKKDPKENNQLKEDALLGKALRYFTDNFGCNNLYDLTGDVDKIMYVSIENYKGYEYIPLIFWYEKELESCSKVLSYKDVGEGVVISDPFLKGFIIDDEQKEGSND